jgi:hypothetical protein
MFVSTIACCAFAATSALATTPEWLDNGATIVTPVSIEQFGALLLHDLRAKITLECGVKGTGTAGPGKEALQSSFNATSCKILEGTCPTPNFTWLTLPYLLELTASGTATVVGVLGESGWQITCAGIIKDTCKIAASVPFVEVVKPASVVEVSYVEAKNQNVATCSLGGKEGDLSGGIAIKGKPEGNEVSVS